MLIASWLTILELRNLMCGLPAVSLVECLGSMLVVTVLVFRASRCGTMSVVASGCMSVITCGAALWVCVLAWIGGTVLGRVILGNVPGVLHQAVHWCVHDFACSTRLDVGLLSNVVGGALLTLSITIHSSWPMSAYTLCPSSPTLCSCARGGLLEIYASRYCARSLRTLSVLALGQTVSMFSWSSDESSLTWLLCEYDGFWQCCGNRLAYPDILYPLVLGT
jgi:hypothetical protein